jgi:lipopolysaccharide export LptBFGC system permease protein LptF
MKIVWTIIGFVVAALIFLGSRNLLSFDPNLFFVLLFLLCFLITISLWLLRKRLR